MMGLLSSAAASDLPVVVKYLLHATPAEAAPALVDALRSRCCGEMPVIAKPSALDLDDRQTHRQLALGLSNFASLSNFVLFIGAPYAAAWASSPRQQLHRCQQLKSDSCLAGTSRPVFVSTVQRTHVLRGIFSCTPDRS